ncbi:sensor histidine kinase [Rudaeicoccus suwonensis]|uniref:Two-component system sensor histidine kinase DesK n=1 Tax=Rudaeicoccus suwonensis TaxID=657409 RepID=A0A561E9Y0_9MICO|nr:sensor histidine kinase [Rudaeicoccus suwonensis]TWE12380.1 two-component system sensor histidine kinase DesK [Rudaeicoccus suwonensis]
MNDRRTRFGIVRIGSAGTTPEDGRGSYDRWMAYFWGGVWLFWLLQPLSVAYDRRATFGGASALVLVPAFVAVYFWHFGSRMAAFGGEKLTLTGSRLVLDRCRYLVQWVIALATVVAIGQIGFTPVVFAAISTMWTFRVRIGFIVALVTGVLYVVAWRSFAGWTSDPGSLVGLGFGTLACGVGRVAGERQHQLRQARSENAALLVQQERNRMARDLHDILGHSLTVITVKAELAGRLLDADAVDRARAELADLEQLSRSALGDVRRAVEGYREISLSGELTRSRDALRVAGIEARMPTALGQVSADLVEVFAWTVREGITNVLRHSEATTCTVSVTPRSITIEDDGIGCRAGSSTGNGLHGLTDRANAAGAVLLTSSVQPHGFRMAVIARDALQDGSSPRSEPSAAAGERNTARSGAVTEGEALA